jgi:hypothetical protein
MAQLSYLLNVSLTSRSSAAKNIRGFLLFFDRGVFDLYGAFSFCHFYRIGRFANFIAIK